MTSVSLRSVEYDDPLTKSTLIADRISTVTPEDARTVITMLRDAYAVELEYSDILPRGVMNAHFGDPEDSITRERQQDRMQCHINGGGSYWSLYRLSDEEKVPVALAKLTPSRGLFRPNIYLNDIVANPYEKHFGLERKTRFGSAVLHAALSSDEYASRATVIADTYRVSATGRSFLDHHGFRQRGKPEGVTTIGKYELEMIRMQAKRSTVLEALEARTPWLANALLSYGT